METTERKQRRAYTSEEDSTIFEMVEGAKKEGMELSAVYKMLSDDLDRTEGAIAKRYADLKKTAAQSQEEENNYQEEQLNSWKKQHPPLSTWQSTVDFTSPEMREYCLKDAQATLDMYEALKKAEEPQKKPEVSLEALVNKLEAVITEKIEMRIERDYYKRKFEELQAKYDKVRRFLEE